MQVNNRKNKILSFESYLCDIEMYCGVDLSEEKKSLKKSGESLLVLMNLATKLDVDPSQLFNKTIDLVVLKNNLDTNKSTRLRERYAQTQFSSTTSLNTILEQIEKTTDTDYFLKRLQIKKNFLEIHRPLSILAINDLLKESAHFLGQNDLEEIGINNAEKFMRLEFGQNFSIKDTPKQIYEKFADLSYLVEENWSYKVEKSRTSEITITTAQTEKMNDFNHGESYTNHLTNTCRLSFIQHISKRLGFSGIEIQNSFRDDDNFKFKINFSSAFRPRSFLKNHGDLFQSGSPTSFDNVLTLQ